MFELFLRGSDPTDIVRTFPGFSLGQVTRARVEGDWDLRRQEYRDSLLSDVQSRLEHAVAESAEFISVQLQVAHKQYLPKMKMFLATGDEALLGNFSIHGWKSYTDALNALKALKDGNSASLPPPAEERVVGSRVASPTVIQAEPVAKVDPQKTIAAQVEIRRAQRAAEVKKP